MFFYGVAPGANQTTNATPNTENDGFFIAPGAQKVYLTYATAFGKAAQLTSLSGIVNRIKVWTSTASSGGTPITPQALDQGNTVAATATAGFATGAVTPGTGGPSLKSAIGCSVSNPGFFDSQGNLDKAVAIPGGATKSIDLFNASGTASLNFELAATIGE
jgi:hypothetical protein